MNISSRKNIIQLMQCLWIYSDAHGKQCKVCKTYRQWVIWSMKEKWSTSYINFDTVVYKLISRDQQYVYIMHIPAHFSLYLQQPLYPDCRCATCVTYKAELAVKHGKKRSILKKLLQPQQNPTTTATTATTTSTKQNFFKVKYTFSVSGTHAV